MRGPIPTRGRLALLALLLCLSLGCADDGATGSQSPALAGPVSETGELSVRPGINDNFLAEDLDVGEYVEMFEGESREVYALREQLVDLLRLQPGDAVADVGAGTGFIARLLAHRVGAEGHVYAVEIAPRFVEHLGELARKEGLESMSVVLAKEDSVELPDASIDLAWVCDTYHHFEYPQSTLASLLRAIRPGGALVIVDFERIPGESEEWLLEHVRAGKKEFRAEIERAGFVLEAEVDAGLEQNYMLRFRRPMTGDRAD